MGSSRVETWDLDESQRIAWQVGLSLIEDVQKAPAEFIGFRNARGEWFIVPKPGNESVIMKFLAGVAWDSMQRAAEEYGSPYADWPLA